MEVCEADDSVGLDTCIFAVDSKIRPFVLCQQLLGAEYRHHICKHAGDCIHEAIDVIKDFLVSKSHRVLGILVEVDLTLCVLLAFYKDSLEAVH